MDETIKNATTEEQLEGQTTMFGDEVKADVTLDVSDSQNEAQTKDDVLKDAIEEQLKKVQRQNLLIGAQTVCTVILQKITTAMNKPGKRTMNDYKRVIKDIEQFCRTGVSRKVNADGEVEPIAEESDTSETVQN